MEDDTKRVRRDVEIDEYDSDLDDEEKQAQLKAKIEGMMEESYIRYLRRRKPDDQTLRGTKAAKRSKKSTALKAAAIANEDADTWDGDAYAKLLTGDASSDDGSSSDDDEVDVCGCVGVKSDFWLSEVLVVFSSFQFLLPNFLRILSFSFSHFLSVFISSDSFTSFV